MSPESSITRQQHLQRLERFCHALHQALTMTGLGSEATLDLWRTSISAECLRCGIRISGEELFALSRPPCELYGTAKLGRLRLGDCARQGCDSFYYRLSFRADARLDWPTILSQVETIRQEDAMPPARHRMTRLRVVAPFTNAAVRFILLLAVGFLVLVARQWYGGGRIPFIREPEVFHVDAGPG